MDAPTIAAFASVAVALVAVLGLVGPVYLRLGRLEGEVKAGRERSDDQFREARERSDDQFREARERSDDQFREARERSDNQLREARERSDAQHAEVLAEIRRLTDAFLTHSHAPDGGIIFRVPPPSGSTAPSTE